MEKPNVIRFRKKVYNQTVEKTTTKNTPLHRHLSSHLIRNQRIQCSIGRNATLKKKFSLV